ncbi:hypothetical protein [Vineibacter terrae]|uniref:hypothetical protein n=1 Tax=Vineibacter terrae TaxID=2586908 RepID=UPI002E359408|nr:hypothetical protein [Vineibacter terrae]HEX2888138.1 hypothetical protein [Vineibacter terrae]
MSVISQPHQTPRPSGAVATAHPFAKAFASGGLVYIAATSVMLLLALRALPADATSYELGYATARALAQFTVAGFVPALIMGMAVQQSPRRWRFWQISLSVMAMFCVTAALQTLGTTPH